MKWISLTTMLMAMMAIAVHATETESFNINMLPTPGKVTVDGKLDDWDLSGGVFVCGDVENLREKIAVWIHAMYDQDNLYVLGRFRDETPLSNPGLAGSDSPWRGDSLQMRIIADPEWKAENGKPAVVWVNAWRDREGKDAIDIDVPWDTNAADKQKNAIAAGARQACSVYENGKGYVQEIALPWKLLIRGGITPEPGKKMIFSVEPNFNTEMGYRITLKDIFSPGKAPDRVFTFMSVRSWGYGLFAAKGNVAPQPLRLADNREFPVRMEDGAPVVDWSGLFDEKELPGFETLTFTMPEDGYVSLNIKNADGQVVRQLLNASFRTKGEHKIQWDGLSNMSHLQPGEVVDPGDYSWDAIYHTSLGLRLIGWADNAGKSPWDSNKGNWGGDHGIPCSVSTRDQLMFLGWSGSEAGKALVVTDLEGNVKWRHKSGGFGGATRIAVGDKLVYVNDNQQKEHVIYRLDIKKGEYRNWKDKDSAELHIEDQATGLAIANGRLYVGLKDAVLALDADTGKRLETITVDAPLDVQSAPDGAVYVLSGSNTIVRINADGTTKSVVEHLKCANAFTVGPDGTFYVGVGDPDNQVEVYDGDGRPVRTIGRKGGRSLIGKWDPNGMRFIRALSLDANGVLWVAEVDHHPKRFSCWTAATGEFVREFFGPTGYGAQGGAISPVDPLTLVGSGCEWKIDKNTGKASCVGVFTRNGVSSARFGRSPDGRLFVATSKSFIQRHPVYIYERLAPGEYKLRNTLSQILKTENNKRGGTRTVQEGIRVWADDNGDEQEQPGEVHEYTVDLGSWIAGWYLPFTADMTFYGTYFQIAPTGWTKCGAPLYDVSQATPLPRPEADNYGGGMGTTRGLGSADRKLMLYNSQYGQDHSSFSCYDIKTGKLRWRYPSNYVGVHGGHRAPPRQVGMIRGAYDIVGTGKLPEPIGNFFVISTDKGEWHILTGEGYYLTSLFEADALKIRFPDLVVPGAILDSVPPGMGAEDFGGSLTVADDGNLYLQAGKTAYINIKVVGLDSVKKLAHGACVVTADELKLASALREKLLQASVGTRVTTVPRRTVDFTGDLRKDFDVDKPIIFGKSKNAGISAAMAYDADNLYLGWSVGDPTPWINGASEPMEMYAKGDTVDFQLGTDPAADAKRSKPGLGDLRLSIGNLKGTPTAVVYRPVSKEQAPHTFYSGVVRDGYVVQSVKVLAAADIVVKANEQRRLYVVEARIPLTSIGLTPTSGMTLGGDIGVTFGDQEGGDTVLRSYWNNQATGLVADEVFELQLKPANWGRLTFE